MKSYPQPVIFKKIEIDVYLPLDMQTNMKGKEMKIQNEKRQETYDFFIVDNSIDCWRTGSVFI